MAGYRVSSAKVASPLVFQ